MVLPPGEHNGVLACCVA